MPAESIGGDVQRSIVQQATSYVVVGGVNTVLSLGLLWLFYRSGLPYPIYTTLVYCTMIFVSFELNRRFAFAASPRSRGQYRQWLIRFCVLHVCNLTIIQLLQAFMADTKIVITGGAGLVGQNLVARLAARDCGPVTVIDKHVANCSILERQHPALRIVRADLATDHHWRECLADCQVLVIGHAQIGGIRSEEFLRNNITATERLLQAAQEHGVGYIVHISSSVVNSMAVDHYTETKKAQEALVAACGIKHGEQHWNGDCA